LKKENVYFQIVLRYSIDEKEKYFLFKVHERIRKLFFQKQSIIKDPDRENEEFEQVTIEVEGKRYTLNNKESLSIIYKQQKIKVSKDELFINIFIPEFGGKAKMVVFGKDHIVNKCELLIPANVRWITDSRTIRMRSKYFEMLIETIKYRRKKLKSNVLKAVKSCPNISLTSASLGLGWPEEFTIRKSRLLLLNYQGPIQVAEYDVSVVSHSHMPANSFSNLSEAGLPESSKPLIILSFEISSH
jgi:hypothetical protein